MQKKMTFLVQERDVSLEHLIVLACYATDNREKIIQYLSRLRGVKQRQAYNIYEEARKKYGIKITVNS